MPTESKFEPDVRAVLEALARRKNVLISGPPGTGKSRLINLVRDLFEWESGATGSDPDAEIPLPDSLGPIPAWFPSPHRDVSRKSFSTVFDQNTKYRDFMRGLVPKVGEAGTFVVNDGTLYRASLHAMEDGHAALVIVDEINRGPAVAAFGSSLVALEADKRLGPNGERTPSTQYFELLDDDGSGTEFALPADVYVLAAMNEADTSVEPLDVAFLRRFAPVRLEPKTEVLRAHLGVGTSETSPPPTPTSASDVYEVLVQAWAALNKRIELGRGAAYRLGHGALMHREAPATGLPEAQTYCLEAWATLSAHLEEVFYGDTHALADLLRAEEGSGPYSLEEELFAGQSVSRVIGPEHLTHEQLYKLLLLVASRE